MFNKATVIGRLGTDPEIKSRHTLFTVGITNNNMDTSWYTISTYGKQAAICRKNLKKGDLCCVTGTLVFATFGNVMQTVLKAEKITFLSNGSYNGKYVDA